MLRGHSIVKIYPDLSGLNPVVRLLKIAGRYIASIENGFFIAKLGYLLGPAIEGVIIYVCAKSAACFGFKIIFNPFAGKIGALLGYFDISFANRVFCV